MPVLESFRLEGRVALVTGASFGLGRAMAEGLAEAGADVVGISRSEGNLVEVGATIEAAGRSFRALECDVASRERIRAAVIQALDWQGRLDILVNNAGIIERSPAAEHPESAWDEVLRVNLDAVWFGSQEAGRVMLSRGGGKIISTASVLSFTGGILVPGYAAAKGALAQLTKALANEWAPHHINVNAIAPGYFVTRNTDALRQDPQRGAAILERIPAGRWGEPGDLKGAVVFLASEASTYVHGHILTVDGGWCAR
ncbi:SDR family oxidoreductase [Candidatus Latescibacterota bacterium]